MVAENVALCCVLIVLRNPCDLDLEQVKDLKDKCTSSFRVVLVCKQTEGILCWILPSKASRKPHELEKQLVLGIEVGLIVCSALFVCVYVGLGLKVSGWKTI